MFTNKTLLITGGTGSFGNAVAKRFLPTDIKEIRIFSRDEKKQNDMRRSFREKMPDHFKKLKFYIGDVRDRQALDQAMNGVDLGFHAAALKQVPSCEFFPLEAVKTNVLGTENVLDSAIANSVSKVICLSTDKAAYPVSAMGMSKAMMEKIVIAKARLNKNAKTVMCCTRYGNVIGSRGSVIPLWIEQIQGDMPITVTDPDMTRFIMSLDEAVDLVVYAFQNAENGDVMVQKAPACTLNTLAEAVCALYGGKKDAIKYIGIRHGEKRYETLLTVEEASRAVDMSNHFRVPCDNRDLNYQAQSVRTVNEAAEEFNSNNTVILDTDAVIEKLKKIL
ncbi:MAG: polysaccharide biosynthesis protein [Clostridia bacterium]|nr:polysaccharide biosynthesis protein [Clostridia bacterium]